MASNIQQVEQAVREATEPGAREGLLARGQARAMIWRDGVAPEEGPRFGSLLSYNLLAYGYALLGHSLRLLEGDGDRDLAQRGFEHAAEALEAVVTNGSDDEEADFHRLVAAAAYHLGRYSARAFSLIHASLDERANLSPIDRAVALLMVRDLNALDALAASWADAERNSDAALRRELEVILDGEDEAEGSPEAADEAVHQVVDRALSENFMAAIGIAVLALERGERELLDQALERLQLGLSGAADLNMVPQWWTHRLTLHLLDELWDCTFHEVLPKTSPSNLPDWVELRDLFISSLMRRKRAELDLWPSQIEAAARAVSVDGNLVVSLPTSAGKTRIAELCILACLAAGRRVMFVTPLRALSAQTEASLQATFRPLGKTVSSLYGSIGVSGADKGLLDSRDIVVATPEKLDFALRNDPALLNDVGLVVLDEGHMIGLNEREVRYEVQIQRLLRRADADQRRIVCLSAILPDDDQLEDFVAWLSKDSDDGLLQKDWRPTRLRFGEVEWRGTDARLNISLGDEKPFVPGFLNAKVPPKGQRKTPFPRDQRELCLATAWRLVEDGQTVLIFCPQRRSVEPFAKTIVDLHTRGALASLLEVPQDRLASALTIGAEWLGPDHVLLKCLRLGVAIHHGALPTPYRREVEALLRQGVLKVTISSPTLAQGLNLAATSLIFHSLARGQEPLKPHEFRNIVGRAGRAFIDVQGLVLYPMFEPSDYRRRQWLDLIEETAGREMESGLVRLVLTLLLRMARKLGTADLSILLEYVAGMPNWTFEALPGEDARTVAAEGASWTSYITMLDTALLSMLGDEEVADADIEAKLDEALSSSLWARRLGRRAKEEQPLFRQVLAARARHIWTATTPAQRRGYFLAGVGLETGQKLDAQGQELTELLVEANGSILVGESERAITALQSFASLVFEIEPFAPEKDPPADWPDLLRGWLKGEPMSAFASVDDSSALRFVEEAFIYRIPWALEAVRVHALARGHVLDHGLTLADIELGLASAAVETGTLNRSAATLMQSGFPSRAAAIQAVRDGDGEFETVSELIAWTRTIKVLELSARPDWPTTETHAMWLDFLQGLRPEKTRTWTRQTADVLATWSDEGAPAPGEPLRMASGSPDLLLGPDYRVRGRLLGTLNADRIGLLRLDAIGQGARLTYLGPDDLRLDAL